MAMVRGTNANKGSVVPSGGAPSRGNSGKSKNVKGHANKSSVVPSTRPASSDKRGGPAVKPGKGGVSSGGGSFGQR